MHQAQPTTANCTLRSHEFEIGRSSFGESRVSISLRSQEILATHSVTRRHRNKIIISLDFDQCSTLKRPNWKPDLGGDLAKMSPIFSAKRSMDSTTDRRLRTKKGPRVTRTRGPLISPLTQYGSFTLRSRVEVMESGATHRVNRSQLPEGVEKRRLVLGASGAAGGSGAGAAAAGVSGVAAGTAGAGGGSSAARGAAGIDDIAGA